MNAYGYNPGLLDKLRLTQMRETAAYHANRAPSKLLSKKEMDIFYRIISLLPFMYGEKSKLQRAAEVATAAGVAAGGVAVADHYAGGDHISKILDNDFSLDVASPGDIYKIMAEQVAKHPALVTIASVTSGGGKAAITPAIAALVVGSGCLGSGDGNPGDKPDPAEPGRIMIRTINENYPGVNEVPDAEKQIADFESWAAEYADKLPIKIKALPYTVKPLLDGEQKAEDGSIYGKSIKPISYDKLGKISPDMAKEAFDADYTGISYLAAYLDGKIDENKFLSLFGLDGDSQKEIKMMKTKGLSIDNFYVTGGVEIKGDENVKYLINTYQTKPDASKQVLTGYVHMKLEKKGTTGKWVPTKVIESEVYTPTGELGFYYVGKIDTSKTGEPLPRYAWLEKKKSGIPLIPGAIENTGMTVDPFIRNVLGRSEVPKGLVTQHYDGGRIITLMKGASKTYQIPSGDYELSFNADADSPDVFDEVIAQLPNEGGFSTVSIVVSEAYGPDSRGLAEPKGLAWVIKKISGASGVSKVEIKDGFLAQTLVPADGVPDTIGIR